MTTWLQCAECNEQFEVSTPIAEAMHQWRADSGEDFLCVDWGDAIAATDREGTGNPVGGNSDSRQLTTESCKQ